ncbi:NCS2 family permease [Priestia endophytica]|jgi:adenine/guanine/hypoxanthine permease|uniref:NCS2 family permease n=1 Tax=Priestia endophytica TaxID=135735 RepID=UPI000DCA455C|nr:NCS2 family permease [Priestia endophytica]MBG9810162.1 guanine permease [Priestia endophytica]MCM3541284.1 NCS2 family permease [Priestia endophytica]MED4074036.1 NCS2 family permease [Priestia endophytica]RAS74960.1 guanine permease [Priestia endophytica]RAS83218.1 guanine permease [Priestia endophytica]
MKKYFEFDKLQTTFRTETLAGFTTFLSMAYILFVNPSILSLADTEGLPDSMHMDQGAIFTATALAAAFGSIMMGILAKYPIALAPGMGLNAFFAYSVVLGMGVPWETALAGVFASGLIFICLTVGGIREKIINAIPIELKYAVGAGIGLYITFIGMKNAEIIVASESTFVALGDLAKGSTLLAVFGLIVTIILLVLRVNGGIFIGMIVTAIVGMLTGLINTPTSIIAPIPSIEPTFGVAISHFGDVFNLDMLVVILTFLFVAFFDTTGTLVAVATQAGLMKDNKLPRAGKALLADSTAAAAGALFGTSTTTAYIESTAGVAAGGRSGFTSVVTGLFFLVALFFSPLLTVVTSAVTAPALIVVGVLMVASLRLIKWDEFETAVPAFFTLIMMPLTYSIATGIAIGFIFYPITMLFKGRGKEVHPVMYGLFVIFLLYFIFLE